MCISSLPLGTLDKIMLFLRKMIDHITAILQILPMSHTLGVSYNSFFLCVFYIGHFYSPKGQFTSFILVQCVVKAICGVIYCKYCNFQFQNMHYFLVIFSILSYILANILITVTLKSVYGNSNFFLLDLTICFCFLVCFFCFFVDFFAYLLHFN